MSAHLSNKTASFGKAIVLVLGLAMAVQLAAVALAGNGVGATLNLGRRNTVNRQTALVGDVSGANLLIKNQGAGSALALKVAQGASPLKVNSARKVKNLNADSVDGRSGGPRGYALIGPGPMAPIIFSREVNGVVYDSTSSRYCFDLTFTPQVAIGSPNINNNATVATVVPSTGVSLSECPEGMRDAAVKVYGSNDPNSVPHNDVSFSIIFE